MTISVTAAAVQPVRMAADKARWTLPETLRSAAAARPDAVCLRDLDGAVLTYGEVVERVERRAAGLHALGVRPGDRVVLMMDNSVDMLLAWFAVNRLGAVEVPVNTANRGQSLRHVLLDSGAGVAVLDARYTAQVAEVAGSVPGLRTAVLRGPVTGALPWDCHALEDLDGPADQLPDVLPDHRSPGAIMYTSGTTGPAKGVVMSHAHMYTFAGHVVEQLEITSDDVYYVCLPLFHGNAQFMQVYAALIAGASVVVRDGFSASRWIEDVRGCGATVSSLLGVMAQYIHDQPRRAADSDNALHRMVTIPLPAAIAEQFERRFQVTCVEAYGMTEVCLPMYRPLHEALRPGSCGKVLEEWFEVAVVDPDTDEPVPDGEVGEFVVRPRSPFTTFSEYHGMPERTVEAWRNLWFHTGDAGRRDADGFYYFVDRIKDRIRRKGENVTAYDIEIALLGIDGVQDVAVVAVPAAEGEDDIKAYVVVRPGADLDHAEVIGHCARQLPYFAVPRYLELIAELPKTPSGKILKRELRSMNGSPHEWDRERAGIRITRHTADSS